jgi:YD repeat-containing protein
LDADYVMGWSYYTPTETAAPPTACGGGSAVDQAGQLKTKAVAGLADQSFVYDSAGRLIAKTAGAGTTCTSYDAEGRITSTEAPGDTQATTYTYDPSGLTLTATDATGTVTSGYDEAGRLHDTVDSFGAETSYAYDGDGNPTSRVAATGALSSSTTYTTGYSYDAADQLTGLTDPAGRRYGFFYDSRGNLQATQYPNGTFSWNDIDPLGQLWLGPDAVRVVNKDGNVIYRSADNTRRVQFHFNNYYPHSGPHVHVDQFINGKWVTRRFPAGS